MYKVGQKVKLLQEVESWGIGEKFTVMEYNSVSVRYLISNGQVDLWVDVPVIKAFGRLIGSKNKKTAKVKTSKEEKRHFMITFLGDSEVHNAYKEAWGENKLKEMLTVLRDEKAIEVYEVRKVKVELVTTLVIK